MTFSNLLTRRPADTPMRFPRLARRTWLVLFLVALTACSKSPKPLPMADIDYWTCTMHPSVHSEGPGKCPICGMDLVPVTLRNGNNQESAKPSEFIVPVQRQQQIGVTYAEAKRRDMRFEIRSVGTLDVDQAKIFECASRVDGYVEELQVTSPGQSVSVGQPLMIIYSPDLRAPEQELVNLCKVQANGGVTPGSMDQLIVAARRRLQYLNVGSTEISELERTGLPTDLLVLRSQCNGVVSEAPMKVGMSVRRGDKLMAIVDLSGMWLWANFYENEVSLLRVGQSVSVTLPAFPTRSFAGKIASIGPTIDPVTRTAAVRIDIANLDGELRPGMYANVVAEIDAGEGLTIPFDAVLPTGLRMLAFVDKGFGKLEPRFIQVGRPFVDLTDPKQERYYQVTGGLREGEHIVSSANFLIDAEAQVQGALKDFGSEQMAR
jgi:Cu(I)/Ag(I) efflux system membrane fusion protein